MSNELAALGVQALVIFAAYCAGRYLLPKVSTETIDSVRLKLEVITSYADSFVVWARKFMGSSTGSEKMAAVVGNLRTIAQRYGIETTDQELTAIAQAAYEAMKAGLQDSIKETNSSDLGDSYTQLASAAAELVKATNNLTSKVETINIEEVSLANDQTVIA